MTDALSFSLSLLDPVFFFICFPFNCYNIVTITNFVKCKQLLSYLPQSIKEPFNAKVSRGFKTYDGMSTLALKTILKTYTWSPILWKDGQRLEKNFIRARFAALDFENPEVSMDSVLNDYSDSWHILGTTRNHQKWKGDQAPCDRFRLLLRFENAISDLQEFKYNMKCLAESKGADEKCVDGARILFPCTEIVSVLSEDGVFDEPVRSAPLPEAVQARREVYVDRAAFHNSYGRLSSFCMRWLSNEIPEGIRNNTCMRLGCDLYRANVPYEEAVQKILASPTYRDRELSHSLIDEIYGAVRNGYNAAEKAAR